MRKTIVLFIYFILLSIASTTLLYAQAIGDSNNDGSIDIIDALLTAQYYVGIHSPGFILSVSDVDDNGSVDIVDALLIAQYYVGIITEFPAEKWVKYVITPDQTDIRVITGSNGTDVDVTLTFSDAGFRVRHWGAVVRDGADFTVNIEVERWTGGSIQVITTETHTYTLGRLEGGTYVFTVLCWEEMVKRTGFVVGTVSTAPPTLPPTPEPTSYPEPDNLGDVRDFEQFDSEAEQMLLTNGFVVLGNTHYDKLSSLYFSLFRTNTEVPVFITTDAMLHIFHMVYDNLLKTAEKEILALKMENLISLMNSQCAIEYGRLPEGSFLKEAARRLWIVFAVGEALIRGETTITATGTEPIREEAQSYVTKVYDHTITEYYPGDDFTMYEPRGHYAGDAQLEEYFRAVKWISRRIFRVYDPTNVTESDYELAGAAIMAFMLMNVDNGASVLWTELYTITSLLIDSADSITPVMVDQGMNKLFGQEYLSNGYDLLERRENLIILRDELLSDAYPESEIIPVPLANPGDLPKKYVQFMGERYVIDGEAMQRTCFPHVPDRILPRGLDIAATVFASTSAYEELADQMSLYPGLQSQVDVLKGEFGLIPPDKWQRSTYNAWLYTIRSLSAIPSGGVPDCMKTRLWQREKLNTQMASWTELRHDNILYAKQTMVPSPWNQGRGLVEPYPEFYLRLEKMCSDLVTAMDTCGVDLTVHRSRLQQLSSWARRFGGYAGKIVNQQPLTPEEQNSIKTWGLNLLDFFSSPVLPEDDPELIADVASGSLTGEVLHEAVGKLNPIIMIYTDTNDNKTLAAVGYVMSYYELIETDWNRLNDKEWKERLAVNPPQRPVWTQGFCQQ